ncbi:MAG: SDR family NAD(P)-dependent oxidoreductase, partial [Nitriliruptorales bacterium]|nr:SDR family NAD(P)-dependent oxidoreductase [Nitriliruptorales bacterium]
MDLGLTGKVAFITGASRGIGRATARVLAGEGCDVVITARGVERLEETAKELANETGATVVPLAGDMSQSADVERCVAETL